MKLEHAQLIAEAAEHRGLEVTLRPDYSGRGMCGGTTAVVGPRQDIIGAITLAALELGRDTTALRHEQDDFAEAMGLLSWDQMGRSDVVAY